MVVLREHAALTQGEIITSDLYSPSERRIDQLLNRVGPVMEVDGTVHFGILPKFITESMCGLFPGTIVLAMGCSTMDHTDLARAFVLEPEAFLLDEPFTTLDPPTRRTLLRDLHQLLRETGVTTIFATHDRNQARTLRDHRPPGFGRHGRNWKPAARWFRFANERIACDRSS